MPRVRAGHRRVLLASDLDGTLLRPDGTLSDTTVRVVNDHVANGGMFTYATARSFTSASRVTSRLDLRLPVVTYGGAVIVDPVTGEVHETRMLDAEAVAEVFDLTSRSDVVQPVVFVMHEGRDRVCWLADRATPGVNAFLGKRRADPRLLPVTDWSTIDKSSVFFISFIGSQRPLRRLLERLREVRARCHVVLAEDIYTPDEWWLELGSPAGTKAAALTTLRSRFDVDTLVCFGDNHNDLPMFAIADTALAVANAVPEVRRAASEVIDANTSDGVARWIIREQTGSSLG